MLKTEKKEKIKIKGIHTFIKRDVKTGKIISKNTYENVICNVCKNALATYLESYITYCAVGTGSGTLSATDTTLWTELDRTVLASITASANILSIIGFFGASDGNGILTEFAYFGGAASATPDSGTMANHGEITETKTSSETLTMESTITVG